MGAGNLERVRALVFDSLKQRRTMLHGIVLAVAATWPQVLKKSGQFGRTLRVSGHLVSPHCCVTVVVCVNWLFKLNN